MSRRTRVSLLVLALAAVATGSVGVAGSAARTASTEATGSAKAPLVRSKRKLAVAKPGPGRGPKIAPTGSGQPPANFPQSAPDEGKGGAVTPNVTDPQGDMLTLTNVVAAAASPDPNNPGSYLLNCSQNGPFYGNQAVGFCGFEQVFDSVSGNQAPQTNTETNYIYDACGTLVASGSTNGWHVVGTNYLTSGVIGSTVFTVPTSGVCWGQWSVTYTFSETFTDGQTLTDSRVATFSVFAVNPAPPGAYGTGNGDASVHNPTCNSGDPVNCASGNFSETFTDVSVPGRGPSLDLTRTYNSLSASTAGIFGFGWSSSYEANVVVNGDGSATVTLGDGSQVTGQPAGGGTYTIPTWANSTLTQNGDGTWTFVQRHTTTYTFGPAGRLTAITDRNGYTTQLAYNGSGQLLTVTDPANRTITFSYGANGFVSQVADPSGQTLSYGYDGAGNLTSVGDQMSRSTSFGYDGSHLLQTMNDPRGGITTNVYDANGRVMQQTDPAGLVTHFAYTGDNFSTSGGTTTITDPHGSITNQNYTSGVMISITKGFGTAAAATWNYGYDPNTFGITSVTDPLNHVTRSTYDGAGNLLTSTDALSRTTTSTYNAFNEPLTVTDPAGIKTTYTYDGNGDVLTKAVAGAGGSPTETTTYTYADGHAGDVTKITDPAGHVDDYTFDAQGDVASATTHPTSGVNNTTAHVFDILGRQVCEASPVATAAGVQCPAAGQPRVANTTTRTYDADNELTSVTDPLGNVTSYAYDADGNQTQVTYPAGHVTKTTYDLDSRRSAVTSGFGSPDASTISYGYDISPGTGACSNSISGATYCTSTTDPSGAVTVNWFNSRNERIKQSQPSSGTSTSTYDAAGNLSTLTTNGGQATYGYDAANATTSITYSNPATGFAAATNVTYAYDADGHRTSMTDASGTTTYTYDSLERLASMTNSGSAVSYGYDLDNEITSITYPGRSQVVNQTYDGAGRESSVTDWLGHTTNFSYDADGNRTTQTYPNTTTATSTYNGNDDLLSRKDAPTSNPSNPFASFTYTYNADSQAQTETDAGTPSPTTQSYGYDQVARLTSSTSGNYAYNSSGDPTQLLQATQSFNAAHEITSSGSTITRVGTASGGDNGTGSSLSLSLPAGVAANDQIILAVTLPGNQSIKSTPTGYTAVGTFTSGTGASNVKLAVYRRTAVAGDTSVTVTFSRTFAKAATLVVYRGVNPTSPIDVSSSGTTVSGTSVVAPSVTTTKANDQLVMAVGAESSTAGTWSAPATMTTRVSQAGGPTTAGAIADQALGAAGATGSRTATFSVTGSLAGALLALQPVQSSYTYDALGDRRTITTAAGTATLAYNQLGQMTAYGSTTYTYNGDGLRTSKKTGNKTEAFTWEPSGPTGIPLVLVDGGVSYVYGPDGLPLEQINGTTVLYYLHDKLGSTRALTSSSGAVVATYTYGAYGSLAGSTGTAANPFGFAGAFTDSESGLLYLQHRYYDAATAQLTSVDALVDATAAAYAYASGDPLDQVDLAGLGCAWYNPVCQVEKHAHVISTVTGVIAVAAAPIPVVGEVVSPIAGAISLGTGALAAAHDVRTGNWTGVGFDALSLIPGAGAEVQSLRALAYSQALRDFDAALQAAIEAGDINAVQRLLLEQGALNNARRIPEAWAGVLGWTSVGADLAGRLADEFGSGC